MSITTRLKKKRMCKEHKLLTVKQLQFAFLSDRRETASLCQNLLSWASTSGPKAHWQASGLYGLRSCLIPREGSRLLQQFPGWSLISSASSGKHERWGCLLSVSVSVSRKWSVKILYVWQRQLHVSSNVRTKYVEIQALVLHVLVHQYPLVALVAVREEADKIVVMELGHDFHFPCEIVQDSVGKRWYL